MTPENFRVFRERLQAECTKVLIDKGKDYSGEKDCLSNFRRLAERLNLSPLQVWSVYIGKHFDAIISFVANGKVSSEPIHGRFVDAINYLNFGLAIIEESADATTDEGR